MYKKKFKPVITRVKLNPEQAVLLCNCYSGYWYSETNDAYPESASSVCDDCQRTYSAVNECYALAAAS